MVKSLRNPPSILVIANPLCIEALIFVLGFVLLGLLKKQRSLTSANITVEVENGWYSLNFTI